MGLNALIKQWVHQATKGPQVNVFALTQWLQSHHIAVKHAHRNAQTLWDQSQVTACFEDPATVLLSTAYLGLTGTVSPLPQEALSHLHETLEDETGQDLAAFIKLLQQRILQLLHEGVQYSLLSTSMCDGLNDAHSRQLLGCVAAAGEMAPRARLGAFAALSKPFCNSREVAWAASRELRRLKLETSVVCEPLTGQMGAIGPQERWNLGTFGRQLGHSSTVGDSAPNVAGRVTLLLGPVDRPWLKRWLACMPQANHCVRAVIKAALAPNMQVEIVTLVAQETLGMWRLGITPDEDASSRGLLGLHAQMGTAKVQQRIFWPAIRKMLSEPLSEVE